MASKSAFLRHHARLEAELAGRTGLVAAGKDWVLCRRLAPAPGRAVNYRWPLARRGRPGVTPGVRVVQPLGLAHDVDDVEHVDYSQFCRLVRRHCELDGSEVDFGDVLADPALASLPSHEGPLARACCYPGRTARSARKAAPAIQPRRPTRSIA
jgi:hypothetical protein